LLENWLPTGVVLNRDRVIDLIDSGML